ncbi:MAG: PaaI family thioesterase [Hyphomonadaceae bacterium]
MHDGTANSAYGRAHVVAEGPFKGWVTWSAGQDPYETHVGPFYYKVNEDGSIVSVLDPQDYHVNGSGALHGGALMSFADFALFSIAHNALSDGSNAVTLTLNSEFVSAGAREGRLEARGEVIRETGSLVFVRGLITQGERALLSFSGTLKKIRKRT